jgi:DnaJ-class molecular chaperone
LFKESIASKRIYEMKTLYDVLQVSESASDDVIKAAYEQLIQKHEEKLKKFPEKEQDILFRIDAIKRAYHILSDPAKRDEYNERLLGPSILPTTEPLLSSPFADFFEYMKKPLAFFVPIIIIFYLVLDSGKELNKTSANERVANKGLETVDKSVEYERELRLKRLELENERLRHKAELERQRLRQSENQSITYQQRQDRELEYRANAGSRILGIYS